MLLRCGRCKAFKPKAEFYKQAAAKRGYQNRCKDCVRLTANEYYAKNAHVREKRRAEQKKYTFTKPEQIIRQCARAKGVDPDEVLAAFKAHDGLCDICGEAPVLQPHQVHLRLQIDHDHSARGVFRGFLCWGCNLGLGAFRDDPAKLAAAIQYLAASAVKLADAA